MRRENARHWQQVRGRKLAGGKFPEYIHKYQEPKGVSRAQFVGYVVSYWHAIVDPNHNWDSKRNADGRWIVAEHQTSGGMAVTPESDKWWYRYMVEYTNITNRHDYEARYQEVSTY
jgi:hypothetical protein